MIFQQQQQREHTFTTPLPSHSSAIPFNLGALIPKLQHSLVPSLFIRAPWSFSPSSPPASDAAGLQPTSNPAFKEGNEGVLLENPLSTYELQRILVRRITNLNLPDDVHTQFADSITDLITTTTSLFAKLYVLNLPNVRNILETHKFITYLIFSQLHPLRVLQAPLFRFIRPLQWLLAPFASFTTPYFLRFATEKVISMVFPIFSRLYSSKRKKSTSSRSRIRGRPSSTSRSIAPSSSSQGGASSTIHRPAIIDDIVGSVYQFGEKALGKLRLAKSRSKQKLPKSQSMQTIPPMQPKYTQSNPGTPSKAETDAHAVGYDTKSDDPEAPGPEINGVSNLMTVFNEIQPVETENKGPSSSTAGQESNASATVRTRFQGS